MPPPRVDGDRISQDPGLWWLCLVKVVKQVLADIDTRQIQALAIDATSGTVLLCRDTGKPVGSALMYNDSRSKSESRLISQVADQESAAHGPTSALAKALWLTKNRPNEAAWVLQQADWITGQFLGHWRDSDHNNAIKLGYDPVNEQWPKWMDLLDLNQENLPRIHTTGAVLGTVGDQARAEFGFSRHTQVLAGTTDGVAAFLAADVSKPGVAVTSLGSTLVLKLLTNSPVFSPEHGVYSHRIGDYWLAGGASNSGGAVLEKYFSCEQLMELEAALDPETDTGLDYYPLARSGERFPVADPDLEPRLEPRPSDPGKFYQGLLEGIADIEADGYMLLSRLAGTTLKAVHSTGGGSKNKAWIRIRERKLAVPVLRAKSDMAAYGIALIAAGHIACHFRKSSDQI